MPYVSMHYKKVVSDGLIFIYKISINSRNMSFMAKNFPLFHFFFFFSAIIFVLFSENTLWFLFVSISW